MSDKDTSKLGLMKLQLIGAVGGLAVIVFWIWRVWPIGGVTGVLLSIAGFILGALVLKVGIDFLGRMLSDATENHSVPTISDKPSP